MPPRKRSTGSRPVRNVVQVKKGEEEGEKKVIVRKIRKISFLPIFGINSLSLSHDSFYEGMEDKDSKIGLNGKKKMSEREREREKGGKRD